jgi:lipopolysaccharide/colanic/teichoic acid biosynthesis glycosyltransferase
MPVRSPLVRAADLVAGTLLLVLAAPLIAALALAVRSSSNGPVLHRQPIVDGRGRRTDLLSFRTMVDGAGTRDHQRIRSVIARGSEGHYTGVGRLLERTGLAGLPRLVNVVRGQASLFAR